MTKTLAVSSLPSFLWVVLMTASGCTDSPNASALAAPTGGSGAAGAAGSGSMQVGGTGQVGGQSTEVGGSAGGSGGNNGGGGTGGRPPHVPVGHYPYPKTNYDEPYRSQFHFTAPGGFLNDVNGLWFWEGTYHLTYQSYAYSLAWGDDYIPGVINRDWAHATSTDLVHWVNEGLMIEADVNSAGAAWSGSTVVDTENTSGLQTGENPVFVSIFTCTSEGTCLAFSNDLGATWQAYSGNPVNIGGPDHTTRDPHVFWHAPTQKWVSVLFDSGMAFDTSPDLKTWTRTSHIAWGNECPAFYELPVDGKASNTKWVLQDAAGAYLLGQFDGATFSPDSAFKDAGGYKPQKMDIGPSFYASQTFYRPTFPSARVVQMAWFRGQGDSWLRGHGVTAPFSQSISVPAELGLVTTPEGVRVTRFPTSEIATLYDEQTHFPATTLEAGQNLLAGIASKAFDFELTIDAAAGTASQITFRIADLTFVYDVTAQTLFDKPLPLRAGKLKLRVLADHGELEVFGNDGLFSYSTS